MLAHLSARDGLRFRRGDEWSIGDQVLGLRATNASTGVVAEGAEGSVYNRLGRRGERVRVQQAALFAGALFSFGDDAVHLRERIHLKFSRLNNLETTLAFKLGHDSCLRATVACRQSGQIVRTCSRVCLGRGITIRPW